MREGRPSEQEEEEYRLCQRSRSEGLFWNNGPTRYFHIPFGLRISDYGACKTLEKRMSWHPDTRFYRVEKVDGADTFYGPALECAVHIGADRRTIKAKAKSGRLYRRLYYVCEISATEFFETTGRLYRIERVFAERY